MNRKPIWIVLALILAASISACGSSSHKTTPPADITVAITTAPPSTLTVNGTASIAATVTNDTANAGVGLVLHSVGNLRRIQPDSYGQRSRYRLHRVSNCRRHRDHCSFHHHPHNHCDSRCNGQRSDSGDGSRWSIHILHERLRFDRTL